MKREVLWLYLFYEILCWVLFTALMLRFCRILVGGGEKANISVTLQTSIVNLFCIMTRKPLSHRDPAKRPHYNREFGLYPCAFCILHGTL